MNKKKQTTTRAKSSAKSAAVALFSPNAITQTHRDMFYSLVALSLLVNLFFFVAWVTLQVTHQYDAEVARMLFTR